MLTDYMSVGGQELWNVPRLQAYLENVGSPFSTGSQVCGCSTLTPAMLGEEAQLGDPGGIPRYNTPILDPAPWYDVDTPSSADYLGFLPLSVTGLEDNPRARNVTNTVGGGGIFGPQRELPRTVTVTGLIIGASCCGSEYGLHYLTEALAGCTGDTCDGDCIEMFNCCPDAAMTRAAFVAQHRRTFRRTALVSGPTVTDRVGSGGGCARGACGANGDIIQVEFVLVMASPWAWTDPTPLLDVDLPSTGTGDCIEWCLSPSRALISSTRTCKTGECQHKPCTSAVNACADPRNPVVAPPTPATPDAGFCVPIGSDRACYTIDLSDRPQWADDAPIITLSAGSKELRNVIISVYEKQEGTTLTCDQIADASRCAPVDRYVITYLPANGTITLDGQVGRATTECEGQCRTASTVFGTLDGGPVQIKPWKCAQYCFCIEVDPLFPPASDASVSVSVSGRVY